MWKVEKYVELPQLIFLCVVVVVVADFDVFGFV